MSHELNAALISMLGYESAPALIEAGPEALDLSPTVRTRFVDEALQTGVIEDWEVDWVSKDSWREDAESHWYFRRSAWAEF